MTIRKKTSRKKTVSKRKKTPLTSTKLKGTLKTLHVRLPHGYELVKRKK